jgi:hypothetical protein
LSPLIFTVRWLSLRLGQYFRVTGEDDQTELLLAVAKGAAVQGSDLLTLMKLYPWWVCSLIRRLINRWQDKQISQFIKLTRDSEIASRLQFSSCQTRYQRLASQLVGQATHPNVKLALEFIRGFPTEKLDRIGND